MNCTGLPTTLDYDGPRDSLSAEAKDDLTTANEDRFTVYEYGANNTATQQTSKTVYEGLDASGTKLNATTYTYNLQGRMSKAEIDSDGDGTVDSTSEYEYNDSGIRVSQTVDGQKTDYLVDHLNPTGYAQVLEEKIAGEILKSYTLGLDVISQQAPGVANGSPLFFLYDGHGSTRGLVDALGVPLSGQIYRYDAFGLAIAFNAANALTSLLYSGEWLDHLTNLQYLRARYYDLATGRFMGLDPFFGNVQDPQSLHKYLYTHGDPIGAVDPTGLWTVAGVLTGITIGATLMSVAIPAIFGGIKAAQAGLSPFEVFRELGKLETWEAGAVALGMGTLMSGGARYMALKLLGPALAKRTVPFLGAGFALYGLYQSIKMTYHMMTSEIPRERANQYIGVMIAASIEAAFIGGVIKLSGIASNGQANDPTYWSLTPKEQQLYNRGSQVLTMKVWNRIRYLSDAVGRGEWLEASLSRCAQVMQVVKGSLQMGLNQVGLGPGGMTTWQWLTSGFTPLARFIFGNSVSNWAAIEAAGAATGDYVSQ